MRNESDLISQETLEGVDRLFLVPVDVLLLLLRENDLGISGGKRNRLNTGTLNTM